MAEAKKDLKPVKTGWVELKFLKDWGSYKKGDVETYHSSTANGLVIRKVAEVTKELVKYVPKKIKE